MALVLRRHPLPLLIVFLATASHGATSSSGGHNYISCRTMQQPAPCGNLTIKYPFYFYNKTGFPLVNNSSYCGYPGLGIQCQVGEDGESAVLQLGNQKYNVLNISHADLTVSVVDQEVSVGDLSCPSVDHNVTFPRNSWLSYPNNTVDYLLFFLNCSLATGPPWPTSQVNCSFAGPSYVLPRRDVPAGDWWRGCLEVAEAPVLKSAVPTYAANDSRWRNGGYGIALRQGFQLTWEQKPLACDQCERSNGWCGYNQAGEFTGCFCSDGQVDSHNCSSVVPVPSSPTAEHHSRSGKYLFISICCGLLLCLLALLFVSHKYGFPCIKSTSTQRIESFLQENGNMHPKRYSYAEVKRMTKSFSVKVGQGGFGAVYRGNISDGRQVAVKMLKESSSDGEEFMNEVASISRTSHVNVVTLLGFCLQGSKRALIYEYMPNGSLERYVFKINNSEHIQTWEKLFDIVIGVARGLEYLHRGCNIRIVHFDIKPHNILLDHNFCPKISDFGLAKIRVNKESAISIAGARGTIGYIAPEVYSKQFGIVTSKSDVYSYGMVVLEMVGARDRNNTSANSESSSQYFPQWIYEHLEDYCISASEINGETTELVRKMIVVGLWCIQLTPTNRPTMTRVVEMLEGSTSTLELPPRMLLS